MPLGSVFVSQVLLDLKLILVSSLSSQGTLVLILDLSFHVVHVVVQSRIIWTAYVVTTVIIGTINHVSACPLKPLLTIAQTKV